MSNVDILAGAEPFSAAGGPHGALVLHGFTGSPQSMRGLARAFAAAGFAVELPRLPGHGTTVADMQTTRWADWSAAAEAAYDELAARCDRVVVAGLSMGGTLSVWLATRHPDIAGIVAINPAIDAGGAMVRDALQGLADQGMQTIPGPGGDVADPTSTELAYAETPVAGMLNLVDAIMALEPHLGAVRSPVLLLHSRQDHVVPASSSDLLERSVSGPVERVTLERSFHVATIDFDKTEIEQRAVEFARTVTGQEHAYGR